VVNNYTHENLNKLIAAFGRGHAELSEQYGDESEKWCMKVIALQKEIELPVETHAEQTKIPF
jgi:predicted urease superfamily metal-dependent hydrolase